MHSDHLHVDQIPIICIWYVRAALYIEVMLFFCRLIDIAPTAPLLSTDFDASHGCYCSASRLLPILFNARRDTLLDTVQN